MSVDSDGLPVRLKPCDNPLCGRLVKYGCKYCCDVCRTAHTDKFEIHPDGPLSHTPTCDERHRQRTTGEEPPKPAPGTAVCSFCGAVHTLDTVKNGEGVVIGEPGDMGVVCRRHFSVPKKVTGAN